MVLNYSETPVEMEVQITVSIFQPKKTHFGVVMSHDDITQGTK